VLQRPGRGEIPARECLGLWLRGRVLTSASRRTSCAGYCMEYHGQREPLKRRDVMRTRVVVVSSPVYGALWWPNNLAPAGPSSVGSGVAPAPRSPVRPGVSLDNNHGAGIGVYDRRDSFLRW
jgi:hypothetical protein